MQNFSNSQSTVLLSELGDMLGLKLTFDEQNQCLLMLDDNLMISIRQSEDSWVLYGMLGEFWQPDNDFFKDLLSLNQSLGEQGQGTLTFDEKNNTVLYLCHIPLKETSRNALYQRLESFVDRLEALMQHLHTSAAGKARMQGQAFSPLAHTYPQDRKI